jgi:hypothetical protein
MYKKTILHRPLNKLCLHERMLTVTECTMILFLLCLKLNQLPWRPQLWVGEGGGGDAQSVAGSQQVEMLSWSALTIAVIMAVNCVVLGSPKLQYVVNQVSQQTCGQDK